MGKQEGIITSLSPNTLTRVGLAAILAIGGFGVSSCARPKPIACQAVGEWRPLNPRADFAAYAKVLEVPVLQVREGKVGKVTCSEQIGPENGLVKVTVDNVGLGYASQCAVIGMIELGPLPSPSSDTLSITGIRMDAMCPALPKGMPSAV